MTVDDNRGLSPTSHSGEGTLRSCLSHYKTNLGNNCALCEMCSDRKQTNLLSDMGSDIHAAFSFTATSFLSQ